MSLWLNRLSTDRVARQAHEDYHEQPLVIAGKRNAAERVIAANDAAANLGLHPGLALAKARDRFPDIIVAEEDATADANLLESIAAWCERYTPLAAADPPDGVLLDISGCAHLFEGEQKLLAELVLRLSRYGFSIRAAVASTIGTAWAISRYGLGGIVKAGDERQALAPLPLSALRLPAETTMALARVGLKRIGDILDLPRAPLTARFGADLLIQLDRALGREREPLTPRTPLAPYVAEQRFAEPIAREEHVLAIIERLAARLRSMLEQRGEGARRIELLLFRTDGEVKRLSVSTSRPVRDARNIRALFVERLAALADEFDPGFGFDLARLSVLIAEPCPPEQIGLERADETDLGHLIDRLAARLGARRVTRIRAQDNHIPELAAIFVPAQMCARAPAFPTSEEDSGWREFRAFRAAAELPMRPLRLLAKPEPIEVIALTPDGAPSRFRWRRALHHVIAAEGPERIEGAWWSEDEGPARDYFRVEDARGRRFWLFRAGLYRDTAHPRWFMHGLFA